MTTSRFGVRRLLLTTFGLTVALAGALAIFAGAARAEPPKLVPYGSFRAVYPMGVAVDQSSSDVYVAALQGANISKFDANGSLISPPSPFSGGSGYYSGVAVDPADSDVYAVDAISQAIDVYDPNSGALLSSFSVSGCANGLFGNLTWSQIATDSTGDVYLACAPENAVRKYSPTGTLLTTFTGAGEAALKAPTGVAVDSAGNVWVANDGSNDIEEFNASGSLIESFKSEGVQALAVDSHDDVYGLVLNSADLCGRLQPPCMHLVEYAANGAQLADAGAGQFRPSQYAPDGAFSMLAVDASTGKVYVTQNAAESEPENNVVWIYGPPTVPAVGKQLADEVSTSEAKLGALVNPGGIATTYRFEYGTSTAYGHSTPLPEGSAGEGVTGRAVWAAASSLEPGTTYHFRVVATNELGTTMGPDQAFTTLTSEQTACTNARVRGGFSARLPDCRAYELVTVPSKNSAEVSVEDHGSLISPPLAARDGDSFEYPVTIPLPGAPTGGYIYLAKRGADGWASEDIIPLESYSAILCDSAGFAAAYSDDLSRAVIRVGAESRVSSGKRGECNNEGLQVVSGEPVGYENLLLRDNSTGAYQLINTLPPGAIPADAHFAGASADLNTIVFEEAASLSPDAPAGVNNGYEWHEGIVRFLPGTPVSVSADGSHVVYTAGSALYVRIDAQRTVQLDESQGPGMSGGGVFQAASTNGQQILFTDDSKLTNDSTAAAGEPDLYECTLPEGASRCELSDLTATESGEHAGVGTVSQLGVKDSSHVYFTAKGVLATNTRAYIDSEGKEALEKAENGRINLYMWSAGATTFIAQLQSGNRAENDEGKGKTSPDGTWFAFITRRSLTGYDNATRLRGLAPEVFLYNAASGELVCGSCNPTGEAPAGISDESTEGSLGDVFDGGRLIFDTSEALVPSDTNGKTDVYEYEDGRLNLISSGTSSSESPLVGASESGDDIFFRARQPLVPQDTQEGAQVIYDARVEGGFPEAIAPPACATADACRTPVSPQPSIYGAPSSQTFAGEGNLAPPVKVRPVVKKKPKTKKAKKSHCKRGKRRHARCATRAKAKSHKGGR